MGRVAIVSCAITPFVKNSGKTIAELAASPCAEILRSTHELRDKIDGVLVSTCSDDQYLGPIVSEMVGLKPKVSQRIDNLCNSGTSAVVTAYSLISSGLCGAVLVAGAEKRDGPGYRLKWDVTRGSYSFPVHWAALFAKAHMRKYKTTEEQLASISVRNRKRAAKNPKALFHDLISVKDVMTSKKIVEPLKLLDCSIACDGSAGVLLVSEKMAKQFECPIWLKGIGQQTTSASFVNATDELTRNQSAISASRQAYQMSGLSPSQIDIAELHDAFSILEIIAIEDLGFAAGGKSFEFIETSNDRINPRGGIMGCGHPAGATGVAQVAEVVSQLTGNAGSNQVQSCKNGLVHNLSAAGSSATVLIMGRE